MVANVRTVLAGKGPLRRAKNRRAPCRLRAALTIGHRDGRLRREHYHRTSTVDSISASSVKDVLSTSVKDVPPLDTEVWPHSYTDSMPRESLWRHPEFVKLFAGQSISQV